MKFLRVLTNCAWICTLQHPQKSFSSSQKSLSFFTIFPTYQDSIAVLRYSFIVKQQYLLFGLPISMLNNFSAKEGPVIIQYKCLVSICVFPELKLCNLLISKTEL
jgi:hypothetical protein